MTRMPGPACGALLDRRRRRSAELLDVPLVEHLHDAEILLAALQDQSRAAIANVEVHVGHRGEQGLFDEGVDRLVGLAQPPGVVGVGAMPFRP